MNTYDIGNDDRPLKPPQIIKTEILWNPFDDIIPRTLKPEVEEKPPEVVEKPKPVVNKNLSLLSFTEEAEEEESNFKPISLLASNRSTPIKPTLKRTRDSLIEETDLDNTQMIEEKPEEKKKKPFEELESSWAQEKEADPERDRIREETDKIIHELKSKKKKSRTTTEKSRIGSQRNTT